MNHPPGCLFGPGRPLSRPEYVNMKTSFREGQLNEFSGKICMEYNFEIEELCQSWEQSDLIYVKGCGKWTTTATPYVCEGLT